MYWTSNPLLSVRHRIERIILIVWCVAAAAASAEACNALVLSNIIHHTSEYKVIIICMSLIKSHSRIKNVISEPVYVLPPPPDQIPIMMRLHYIPKLSTNKINNLLCLCTYLVCNAWYSLFYVFHLSFHRFVFRLRFSKATIWLHRVQRSVNHPYCASTIWSHSAHGPQKQNRESLIIINPMCNCASCADGLSNTIHTIDKTTNNSNGYECIGIIIPGRYWFRFDRARPTN